MKKLLKKTILLALFVACCATTLLTWSNIHNVQSLSGTYILTGNVLLSALIVVLYGVSVLFYEKAQKVFFCLGLCSLSMLFAIMFSEFESLGRFSNTCVGPYLGLLTVIATAIVYIWLNIRQKGCKSDEI